MHRQISKKIFIYLLIFLILGTINNKNFLKEDLIKITNLKKIEIIGIKDKNIELDLSKFKNQNLFLLNKDNISKIIQKHQIVEKFFVFKNYPNNLNIKIDKTKLLAIIKKDSSNFYIGTNGKLIKADKDLIDLPFIFGDVEILEFLKLKKIIDQSNLSFNQIDNLYFFKSRRWDIKTKDGLLIKLPKKKIDESLKVLLKIINNNKLNNFKKINLRQINQVILNG